VKRVMVSTAVVICALLTGPAAAGASTGWQLEPMLKPPGAGSTIMESVSCPAAGNCTAVGIFHRNGAFTLAEHWNGTRWVIQPTPNLPRGFHNPLEEAVSCVSPASCTAVVDSSPPSIGGWHSLAEH